MDFSKLSGLTGKIHHSTLGILLWDESVDVVLIEQSILGPAIHLMERLPNDEAVFETVAARLAELTKTPARVVVCLPRAEAAARTLRYPALVQGDLEQMVPFEATRHLPFPEADRCLGYASALSEDEKNLDVQLLAARKEDVDRVVAAMQSAGLPADAVLTFSPLVATEYSDIPSLLVVSDARRIEVSLICNGLVCDSMLLPREERVPLGQHAQRLIAAHEERLGAAGVARILLAGPVPLDADDQEALCVTLGVKAVPVGVPESMGAALGEFEGEPLPEGLCAVCCLPPASLNLVETTRRSVPMSRQTKWILGLAALLVIEVMAAWILWTNGPDRAQAGVENDLAALRRRAAPIQKMKEQNRVMHNELGQLHELVNTRVSVMDLLKTLSDAFPEYTYLTSVQYERGDQLKVKGRSKEPDKLPALMLEMPFVSTIEDSDIDEKRGEYHTFSFTVAVKGAGNE